MPQLNSYERKKGLDSTNIDIANAARAVDLSAAARGETPIVDEQNGVESDVERVVDLRLMEHERFMAEPLLVHLHDAGSEDEPQFVELTVNGIYHCIRRGEQKEIPRAHVGVLAQSKQMRLTQKKVTNSDGSMGYQEMAVLRLTYPFSVLHDASPRGGAWLGQLLKNPT